MKARQQLLDYIAKIEPILSQANLNHNAITELQKTIECAELIVPVVGGFSAGKSTLINTFLGEDLLLTKVTPETALATELRYSSDSYIEAVRADGNTERHDLNSMVTLRDNAIQYQFLRLYLNNDNLKAIQPLVLVDMPGFDAPVANHNKAILDYLNKGCYFIFLTSIEDGTLSRTMIREIENIQCFAKDFSFCISKTNLRAPSDVENIRQTISNQLEDYFDFDREVVLFDNNGGHNLKKILTAIDPEALFNALFIDALREENLSTTERINLMISALKATKQSSDKALAKLQEGFDSIIKKRERAITDIQNKYSIHSIDSIINGVSRTLMQNKANLVELALTDKSLFEYEINELIRNSLLLEVGNHYQSISYDIIQDFSIDLKHNLSDIEGFNLDNEFVDRLSQTTKALLNKAQVGLNSLVQQVKDKSVENKVDTQNENDTLRKGYRVVATVLGITTSVVSPLIEITIVFLPEILSFFTKNTNEKKLREAVERQLVMMVIPQIKAKIRTIAPELLNNGITSLINEVSAQFEKEIQEKRADIERTTQEKATEAQEVAQQVKALEEVKKTLSNFANQYLY